ncbi:fatty acid oxidation complex subunit alpha FadB [Marinobacterium rhizophilum]|uniref:fatty acid oxidation complex subunit alpha FadB n=1 Tax=Marinobacterium rhizophilum TaxID=420402 RepID=UPI00036ECC14|nr:fatty acid oxidation complex subunit alpha FadB [Marinobacterium rhizophilum]
MLFNGFRLQLRVDHGIAELRFERRDGPVNTLDHVTLSELHQALELLQQESGVQGLLLTSGKRDFIVGADINEFSELFGLDHSALTASLRQTHALFQQLENLPYPTLAAINGMALGGGMELTLACDYRVLGEAARVGLPEVNLGIYPGWGGTVRLSRLAGIATSLGWILSGRPQRAGAALEAGVAHQVVADAQLGDEARAFLLQQIDAGDDFTSERQRKQRPLVLDEAAQQQLFEAAKQVARQHGDHYPAPRAVLELVREHAELPFDQALECELNGFPGVAKGPVAKSLVGLFLSDQLVKRKAKATTSEARNVSQAAVLGAGIMGGGIAYQSASTGTPIRMKDITGDALELGMREADKLLAKQVERGRLGDANRRAVLETIMPTLEYDGFDAVDLVIEAVVENPKVKASVLAEVERAAPNAVIASNTSSISISQLAESLQHPENFCGMHFFNPVHAMPLVEVIRGKQSSDAAIATTVAYAVSMGKTPIVVNDCPGFLVNRILFPYFNAFNRLLKDGVDYQRIDRVMESFGWPMGPAFLADVVGLDTLVHADAVMVDGFPERMGHDGQTVAEAMLRNGRLGQKNGRGFYRYGVDEQGKRFKAAEDEVYGLVESLATSMPEISDHEIGERMLIPLCLEAVRCLEEGIADSAAEVDMGLVLGLGFPRFRGGPLRYIDTLGIEVFCNLVEKHQNQGPLYRLTDGLRQRRAGQKTFF